MNENSSEDHFSDTEALRHYAAGREHAELPHDLPVNLQNALVNDPNPETIQWVIDESHGDSPLLALLLNRESISDKLLNHNLERDSVKRDLVAVNEAIRERKNELGLHKNYRF